MSTRLSSCREGNKSWCRCNRRWKSNMLSNSRRGVLAQVCKGRRMNSIRSLSSGDEGRRKTVVSWCCKTIY